MMCSTRKLVAAGVSLGMLAGCSSTHTQDAKTEYHDFRQKMIVDSRPSQYRYDAVQADPPDDNASAVRTWGRNDYVYPSGVTLAYPTYHLNVEDRRGILANDYYYSIALAGLIVVDTVTMPVKMIIETPNTAVEYHGTHLPPSQTVAPPFPAQ